MPFESKAQARYLYAKHPKIAKEFEKKTPSIKALPEKKEMTRRWRSSDTGSYKA